MKRAMRLILVLTLPLIPGACGDDGDGSAPTPRSSADFLQPGPYGVGVTTMTFEDTTRPTRSNGDFPGSPTRVLGTDIRYPTAPNASATLDDQRDAPLAVSEGPYPLIVDGHGIGGNRFHLAYLKQHLASYGYVVAAPDFPLTKEGASGGSRSFDWDAGAQAEDVSFLIDRLLALNDTPESVLFGAIDTEKIGLTGLSAGGFTNFVATFHPTRRDARIRAMVGLAAAGGCLLSSAYFDDVHVPLLLVHGTLDAYVPYEGDARHPFAQANAPKYLVTLDGGTHIGFTGSRAWDTLLNVDEFFCIANNRQPDFARIAEILGGTDEGVAVHDCRPVCEFTTWPPAMLPSRQAELTILSVLPFFEAYLRGYDAWQQFLENTLAAENAEVMVEFER